MRLYGLVGIALALALALVGSVQDASAQTSTGTVIAPSGIPLLVDGYRETGFPKQVPTNVQVCVVGEYTYISEVERYRFIRWQKGNVAAGGQCASLGIVSSMTLILEREYLMRVTSNVPSIEEHRWVPEGVAAEFSVPAQVVESESTAWRFAGWSAGERPNETTNVLAAVRSTTLEARYTREFRVDALPNEDVTPSGSGWYAAGARAVLSVPQTVSLTDGVRLAFVRWEEVGERSTALGGLDKATLTFPVTDSVALRPVWVEEYLVRAVGPQGVIKQDWVRSGSLVTIEGPERIDLRADQERLVFKRWIDTAGAADSTLAQTTRFQAAVNRPMLLEAQYQREFRIVLDSPYGGVGTGWYAEGSTARISVPADPQSVLFFKKAFNGFAGYPSSGPLLPLEVTAPQTVAASYRNQLDLGFIAIILLVFGAAYALWRWTERQRSVIVATEVLEAEAEPEPASKPEHETVWTRSH